MTTVGTKGVLVTAGDDCGHKGSVVDTHDGHRETGEWLKDNRLVDCNETYQFSTQL